MSYVRASIAATYGVDGFENRAITFISPEWIDKINYSTQRASERNMGIDDSLSSAWPFGGPNVTGKIAGKLSNWGKLFSVGGTDKVSKRAYNPENKKIEAISAFSDKGKYLDLIKYFSLKVMLE